MEGFFKLYTVTECGVIGIKVPAVRDGPPNLALCCDNYNQVSARSSICPETQRVERECGSMSDE